MATKMKPKTFGRKSVSVKPRRSTIESVVSTIIPFMGTDHSTGSSLQDNQVQDNMKQRNRKEKCDLNIR
jgi:hypothetical protein